ncbi:MAG: hypothetical protein sL5_10630 [Candidatus Mesenet longicola]|uniref:Uncharacterized protein n=1 Tax=Candidatus Mesenet longicola TaxID=1892558 RepID=A0A8J3HW93_9RICK|nr:MAG: hypothetical protein sL5_10630 [Candidatus Mesenet longicola]
MSKGQALLDCEIIELLLYAVHRRIQARITAKELIDNLSSIGKVLGSEMDDLKNIKSVHNSTIAVIFCMKEILKRILREEIEALPIVSNWSKLIDYLKVSVGMYDKMNFRVIYLNKKYRIIADEYKNMEQ